VYIADWSELFFRRFFKSSTLFLFSVGAFLLAGTTAQATHIKAGEITITNGAGAAIFNITLTLYLDAAAVAATPGLEENEETFNFGPNIPSVVVPVLSKTNIGNNTIQQIYTFTQNFGFISGQTYTVSIRIQNRDNYIVNINGKKGDNSLMEAFYVESTIYTNASYGPITSPILENPPIDNATPGVIFTHNPGAVAGTKGDSLSFELVPPKTDRNLSVPLYQDPADPIYGGSSVNGGPATFTMNPLNGELTWDTPAPYFATNDPYPYSLYNIAIKITEWRKLNDGTYVPISYIIRDMQIQVKERPNKRPELKIPPDTCFIVTAGATLKDTIYASDPDLPKQQIILTATSEVLPKPAAFILNSPVSLTDNIINNPGTALFNWTPTCRDVRTLPYYVVFEAQDNVDYDIRLTNYQTMQITVYGEQPKNFQVVHTLAGFRLSWEKYFCGGNGSDSIFIYRKDCRTDTFRSAPCQPNALLSQGFAKVGSASATDTTYTDTHIKDGSYYCYVIMAHFPLQGGGLSYPSQEICLSSFQESAVITNVSVEKTDSADGAIKVKWLNDITGPVTGYEYKLYRATGIKGGNYTQVYTSTNLEDSVFTDTVPVLNTRDTSYNYRLEVYKNAQLLAETDTASSVYLNIVPTPGNFALSWTYQVPWDNTIYTHYIYRKKNQETVFTLLDSAAVSSDSIGFYNDATVTKNDTFCYFVETRGKYCYDSLPSVLINKSQVMCDAFYIPCPPVLSLVDEDCSLPQDPQPYKNYLSWIFNDTTCLIDLKGFKLYFAPQQGANFTLLASLSKDTFSYVYQDYASQAGCYSVTSFNNHGLESVQSNVECNDNCVNYELPNLVTPDNNGKNDLFTAMDFPRGILGVELFVYNRWGALVHYQENNVTLDWNPKLPSALADGVYYYLAKITYERRLNPKDTGKQLKGWVEIISGQKSN
jgi:hypothetical protein